MKKKIQNSMEIVVGHFQSLLVKCLQTKDDKERVVLVRRLINLLGVIQFLISVQNSISNV
jgi:hypothetical protein